LQADPPENVQSLGFGREQQLPSPGDCMSIRRNGGRACEQTASVGGLFVKRRCQLWAWCVTLGIMSPQIDATEQVLEALQEALKAELTAVHQYLLHAKVCQNWGYQRLADQNRKESLEEFKHAEALIERILFLKGTPNMTDLNEIKDCADVKEQFESDLALEMEALARLNSAIDVARDAHDNVSRRLFDSILADEDQHVDHLEGQLHIINEIGLSNYLAQQIGG
jgi:bacterioferritin